MYQLPKKLHPDFRLPNTKPASNVEIDRDNKLSEGLASFHLLKDLYSFGDGTFATNYNNGATKIAQGFSFDGSNDVIKINNNTYDFTQMGSNGFTIVARLKANAVSDRRFISMGNSSTGFLGVGTTSTSPFKKLRVFSTAPYQSSTWVGDSVGEIADGKYHTIAIAFIPDGDAVIAIDGAIDSRIFRTGAVGTDATPFSGIGAVVRGSSPDGASFYSGEIEFSGLYHRPLADAELKAFTVDPYQILKPATPQFYFTGSGSGAYSLTADSGSFTLTGTAATLKSARTISAISGSYALTGNAATLSAGKKLPSDSGSFTHIGTAAGLVAGRKITADSGSFVFTGMAATLTYTPVSGAYSLAADSGTFTLTGTAASLVRDAKLVSDSGAFTLTGAAAGLRRDYTLTASGGAFSYTGQPASWLRTYGISADSGAFTLTGVNADLTYSAIVTITPTPFTIYAQHRPIEIRSDAAPFSIVSGR